MFQRKSLTIRQGTFLYRIRTPLKQVVRVFRLLVEGMSIRGIERVEGIKQDTILDWLRKAGQHVEEVNALLIHYLHLTQVQIDEFWSFVKNKEKQVDPEHDDLQEVGDLGGDSDARAQPVAVGGALWQAYSRGGRDFHRQDQGLQRWDRPAVHLGQVDLLPRAVAEAFSTLEPVPRRYPRGRPPGPKRVPLPGLLYAQVDKPRRQGRVIRVVKRIVIGNETAIRQVLEANGWGTTINTAYVERANGTVRHKNRRLPRKTYGFSKKTDWHRAQLAVETLHYSFLQCQDALRLPLPRTQLSQPKWQRHTPAMAEGITDHRWSFEELFWFVTPPQKTLMQPTLSGDHDELSVSKGALPKIASYWKKQGDRG